RPGLRTMPQHSMTSAASRAGRVGAEPGVPEAGVSVRHFAFGPPRSTRSGRQDEPQLTSRRGHCLLIRQNLGGILALLMHDPCAQRDPVVVVVFPPDYA